MSATDPTVFVIDDDKDIRSSLTRSLGKRGFTVETFDSAQAFLDTYDPELKGCIILDYGMPGMTGLELQEVLVCKGRPLPIIFITGHGGVPESVQAMKAGAIDFLEKPFRSDVLVDCINTAFETFVQASVGHEKSDAARQKLANLTSREKEIVDFIVANPSKTSSKDIARKLDISPRTVDHHRARILEKMNIKSIIELIDLVTLAQS
jgi:two-component system response regulator FixJ